MHKIICCFQCTICVIISQLFLRKIKKVVDK
nr:MAG TPA: hypothetical protein [Caudoviricetes sp.]